MSASRPGREEAFELLRISAAVDERRIPSGPRLLEAQTLAALLVRARRLTRSALLLLDEELDLEAAVLTRALMDTVVTLMWLAKDLGSRQPRWLLADVEERLKLDDQFANAHDGKHLFAPEDRGRWRATRSRLRARGVKGLPDSRQRFDDVKAWHPILYRQMSNGASHPTPDAVDRFIFEKPDGTVLVEAYGARTRDEDDPYLRAALLLSMALEVPAQMIPDVVPWAAADLAEIRASVERGIAAREGT